MKTASERTTQVHALNGQWFDEHGYDTIEPIFAAAMAEARDAALEEAAVIADSEPEPGEWTDLERHSVDAVDRKALANAAVVVTKRNIARDIRALKDRS